MKEQRITFSEAMGSLDETCDTTEQLLLHARAAAQRAYAPYSGFRVGAAALLSNGEIIEGNNQENVAYPSGLCAERVAVFAANSRFPNEKITHLLICAETDKGIVEKPVTPCGACRQVIAEKQRQQGKPIVILLAGKDVVYRIDNALNLLPLSFEF